MEEITLNHICKIEGHANLSVKIDRGKIKSCELEATEGARFFEALTIGKKFEDVQEVVSRICGICSSAHGVASILALENAFGIKASEREMHIRELLMLGERIRSHATHLYFLSLPDYVGYSAITMAKNYKKEVDDALKLIRAGNGLIEKIGGRDMHPFIKFHSGVKEFDELKENLKRISPLVEKTIKLFSSLKYPVFKRQTGHLCLREKGHYACISGEITSESHNIKTSDYKKHLEENIKEYATSKFVLHDKNPFLTGALIRLNTNAGIIDKETKGLIERYKIKIPMDNPFHNNVAQAIELHLAIARAIELLGNLEKNNDTPIKRDSENGNGHGVAAVEAPRGTLFHEYEVKEGKITYCNIITPTAQNLNQMEIDIKNYIQMLLDKRIAKDKIILEIEKLIRAYDPCFSCSTHFLNVKWDEN